MSLFEVPGWSVGAAPVASQSKKRKRPSKKEKEVDEVDEAQMIKAAQKNIEKLMQSLGTTSDALDVEDEPKPSKKKRTGKEKKEKEAAAEPEKVRGTERDGKKSREQKAEGKGKQAEKVSKAEFLAEIPEEKAAPTQKKQKAKQKEKQQAKHADTAAVDPVASSSAEAPTHPASPKARNTEQPKPKKSNKPNNAEKPQGLTPLQANMKKSLDGARFRLINETLYKTDSAKAHELMRSDPAVFADYHTGFRHQVESWPTNPVSHYISTLSSYPKKTVIADLGCGDAALARALVPKGMSVLSFDLVSDSAYVIEADTCDRVPLPGSERPLEESADDASDEHVGEGQVVDVVVCALSLMGTNWPGCIREAWRILKAGGELKVAEVASRFTSVDEFTSFVCSFGFTLTSKDDRNTHFTLFEFEKASRKLKSEKEWKKLMARGAILKPCEYKRR
ncbi:Ribosomal RNA-processing protein 8 [Trametes pubescens]|uniref:Ribosomal RNA-processing protein 8 n=1 Tax=Trametes pubescens TaxID=154538 RepID=A0A1M2W0R5_TRAPU|nr:Ribosomal RNA-processing protein 8 [Trametes pubescens]